MLIVGHVPLDRFAGSGVRPQSFRFTVRVLRDDRVGCIEDRLRGTVVLLQQDNGRVRVVGLELKDVADRGATKGVDALVGVTDDGEL